MKPMYAALFAISVLISVPYLLPADALEMKYVPFWWHTDPLTGEEVYTDYFNEVSSVQKEHKAYLASIAKGQSPSVFDPSTLLEIERSGMVEVITYEKKYIPIKDTMNPISYGFYANPDYMVLAEVEISTWIKAPVVVEEVVEEIIEVVEEITEITQETVTEITEDITPVVTEPKRIVSGNSDTHWDSEEQIISGHDYLTTQQIKEQKLKMAEWRAYETASEMYPTLYPPYVHHNEVVEDVAVYVPEVVPNIVVPMPESEVIIDIAPEVTLPSVTSSAVVVPIPEPIVEPVPLPSVTSSAIVQEPLPFDQDLTDEEWDGQLDIIKQFPESLTNPGATPVLVPGIPTIPDFNPEDIILP
jgi:hypothetical protein